MDTPNDPKGAAGAIAERDALLRLCETIVDARDCTSVDRVVECRCSGCTNNKNELLTLKSKILQ